MNQNVAFLDRICRYVLGLILLTWAVAGGPAWTFVGLFFLLTGSIGVCPVYWAFRINSRP